MNNQIKTWLAAGSINFFGRQFSGKDTQARKLAELFGGAVVGGGDILRTHQEPGQITEVMNTGALIPSDFFIKLMQSYISKPEFKNKPLMLSAVGRSHGEESSIMQALENSGHQLKAAILLEISESEVWKRYEAAKALGDRGTRADDDRQALQTRLQEFQDKTVPVIEFYRTNNLLIEVDGSLPREQVTDAILQNLLKIVDA